MRRRTALATLPGRTVPAVNGSNVVAFPRRAPRRSVGHITHAGGGPVGPSEHVDAIIRRMWWFHCSGQILEAAAGELHDALCRLRDVEALRPLAFGGVMTDVAAQLRENGISLDAVSVRRHYTTCPQCSQQRKGAHQRLKVLGVTIEHDGARWAVTIARGPGRSRAAKPTALAPDTLIETFITIT